MRALILVIGASLALTACNTTGGIQVPEAGVALNTPVCAGQKVDEQLWYAAEAAYNVPAQAYVAAYRRGLISAELKATLKPKLQTMNQVRLAAKAAYLACDAATLQQKLDALKALKAEVDPLIPR